MRLTRKSGAAAALVVGGAAAMLGGTFQGDLTTERDTATPVADRASATEADVRAAAAHGRMAPVPPVVAAADVAPSFLAPISIAMGGLPTNVALADVNGDRRKDLVVVVAPVPFNYYNAVQVQVRLQSADGSLAAPRMTELPYRPNALRIADFNRDGLQDVMVGLGSGARLGLGTRSGDLAWQVPFPGFRPDDYPPGITSTSLPLDFDLDGDLDMVSLFEGATGESLIVFANDGAGRMADGRWAFLGPFFQSYMRTLQSGDVNGDGSTDLLVGFQNDYLRVFGASPSGPGLQQIDQPAVVVTATSVVGDFNSDARDDLAYPVDPGKATPLAVSYQTLAGTLYRGQLIGPASGVPTTLVTADLQGDGVDDLLVGHADGRIDYHAQANRVLGPKVGLPKPAGFPVSAPSGDRPGPSLASGDITGDGCPDVLFAQWTTELYVYPGVDCVRPDAIAQDVDGDGRGEILWRNPVSGANELWRAADRRLRMFLAPMAPEWSLVATGDFDGNARSDVFWRNRVTGANALWRSAQASLPLAVLPEPNPAWQVVGVGDFDNDSRGDLFWRHATTGANRLWRGADGRSPVALDTMAGADWQVAGIGDFTGDAKDDVVWRNAATGANELWGAGSRAQRREITAVTALDWKIAGIADFNGDGVADILWRHARNGDNVVWFSGRLAARRNLATVADTRWQVAGVADYDGDGKADILWRHSLTGGNELWSEGNVRFRKVLPAVGTAWAVMPK